MRKRLLSIFGVCLVLCSLVSLFVIPVGAISNGTGLFCYAPIRFDTIGTSQSDTLHSWVFNNSQVGTSSAKFSFDNGWISGNASCYESNLCYYLSGSFSYPDSAASVGVSSVITLSCDTDQFVSRSLLDTYEIAVGSSMDLVSVRIYGSAYYVSSSSGVGSNSETYSLLWDSFDRVFYEVNDGDGVARIGSWLLDCLDGLSHDVGDSWFFLNSVNVDITFTRSDVVTPSFLVMSRLTPNYSGTSGLQWFYRQGLTKSVVDNNFDNQDLYSWLVNSIDAFFNFELAPGLSFNKIFYIILVIGVLIWFIKLFS